MTVLASIAVHRDVESTEDIMRTLSGRWILAALLTAACLAPGSAGAEVHPRAERAKVATTTGDHPVNINTADVKELMTLDGIGHKVAEKIVQYRDAHGEFKKPEEIRKVDGVGGGLWERNRARIVVK